MGRAAAAVSVYSRSLRTLPQKLLLASPPAWRRALVPRLFSGLTPEFLWIEATAACDSRCQFCAIGAKVPAQGALAPAELEATLRDPLFRGLRTVVVSGGEPTLRPDLEAVLTSIHRAVPAARLVLSSSAAMPERLVGATESALAQGIRLEVGVSVDGIGARHDAMRGVPGLFAKVDFALRQLSALRRVWGPRLALSVGMVICNETAEQVQSVRTYAAELGAAFNPQWYNQADYYGNVGRDQLSNTSVLLRVARELEPSLLNEVAQRVMQGRAPRARCTMMFNACLLKSSGDLVPCFAMWGLRVGNVRQATPSQIWISEKARHARLSVTTCDGCLNTCGVMWSYDADYLRRTWFYLRHPRVLAAKLRERLAWL